MRDLVLLCGLLAGFGVTLRFPFAGVIIWGWLSFMVPQMMVYGFLSGAPVNFGMAALTLGLWVVSKERKGWPGDALPPLMLLFIGWMLVNSYMAPHPEWSASKFDLTMKTYPLVLLCLAMCNTKARIQAIVWTLAISLGFFGVKGGAFTIATGGSFRVVGPGAIYTDNNQMALALVLALPLIYYLWESTENRLLRYGLAGAMALQTVSVIGSYSRGGMIALFAMLFMFWRRSQRKLLYLVLGVALVGGALSLMPPQFFERMNTIRDAGADQSFMERVTSWQVCLGYAVDHFPFGAGFNGTLHPEIFHHYFPDFTPFVAHSIYFQVLGDHGFPGLLIYLLINWTAWRNARIVSRRCRNQPSLAWAAKLASSLEVSLIGFYVGGAALSIPYWDGFLTVQALTSVLREMTDPKRRPLRQTTEKQMTEKPGRRMAEAPAAGAIPSGG